MIKRRVETLKISNSKVLGILGKLLKKEKFDNRKFIVHKEARKKLEKVQKMKKISLSQYGSSPLKLKVNEKGDITTLEKSDIMIFLSDIKTMKISKSYLKLESKNHIKGILLSNSNSSTCYFLHGNYDLFYFERKIQSLIKGIKIEIKISVEFSIPEEEIEESVQEEEKTETEKKKNTLELKSSRTITNFELSNEKNLELELVRSKEKERLLTEENKGLKRKIKRNGSEIELLIKENEQLKHDNNVYSRELEDFQAKMQNLQRKTEIFKKELNDQNLTLIGEFKNKFEINEKYIMRKLRSVKREKIELEEICKKLQEELGSYKRKTSVLEESKQRMIKLMNTKDEQFYKISLELKELTSELEDIKNQKSFLGKELKMEKLKSLRLSENLNVSIVEIKSLKSERVVPKKKVRKNLGKDFNEMAILKSFINFRDQKLSQDLKKSSCKKCEKKRKYEKNEQTLTKSPFSDSDDNVMLESSVRRGIHQISTQKKNLKENLQLQRILDILDKILNPLLRRKVELNTLRSLKSNKILESIHANLTTRELIDKCLKKTVEVYKEFKNWKNKEKDIEDQENMSKMTIKLLQQKINFNKIREQRKKKNHRKKNNRYCDLELEINTEEYENKENIMDFGNFYF